MRTPEEYEILRASLESDYLTRFSLEQFGDHLQDEHGYVSGGMQGIAYHLFLKYHWPLDTVSKMPLDDLLTVLGSEFSDWATSRYLPN